MAGISSGGTWWGSGELESSSQPEWGQGKGQEATWLAGRLPQGHVPLRVGYYVDHQKVSAMKAGIFVIKYSPEFPGVLHNSHSKLLVQ